jgi:hypothetical protein
MTLQATARKLKRSFTLTPESVAFVAEMRKKRRANSDSEALDLLLRELMLEAKRRQLDAATKAYYDTATDEELTEQREWAEIAGPNMFVDMDSAEAQP